MNISHRRKWKEKFTIKEPVILYHFHLKIKPKNKEMTVLECKKHLFSKKLPLTSPILVLKLPLM